jgi:hypothetical protein
VHGQEEGGSGSARCCAALYDVIAVQQRQRVWGTLVKCTTVPVQMTNSKQLRYPPG